MKRKNGFTLIELLAVIVILAIIALIATPIILGVIETARKGAAESSALGYIDAVEKQIAINILDSDEKNNIVDDTYTVEKLTEKGVTIKGNPPTGKVIIKDGRVVDYTLVVDGKYTITPTSTNSGNETIDWTCKTSGNKDNLQIGDEVTCGKEHFYVYNPSDTNGNVRMLAKYNLYIGGKYDKTTGAYNPYSEDKITYMQDESMKGSISGQTIAAGITNFSSDEKKGPDYSDYKGSIVEDYVINYMLKLRALGVNVLDSKILEKSELETLVNNGEVFGSKVSIKSKADALKISWIYSTTYWLATASATDRIWNLNNNELNTSGYNSKSSYGVRPVIIISKGEIK